MAQRRYQVTGGAATKETSRGKEESQDPRSLGTVNKKIHQSIREEKEKFYSSQAEDYNPLRKSLRKLSELFCLLEVKAQLYKVLR